MIGKREFVHRLTDVKLVIGNGFDLQCRLKTKYSDFFQKNEPRNQALEKWFRDFQIQVYSYSDFTIDLGNREDFWVHLEGFDELNVWDIFFFLVSRGNASIQNWRWCDIESTMLEWLKGTAGKTEGDESRDFSTVLSILRGERKPDPKTIKSSVLAAVIYRKYHNQKFGCESDFYRFLLMQLQRFEAEFGDYINRLQHDENYNPAFGICNFKELFIRASESTIGLLCDPKNISSIDSFNYGAVFAGQEFQRPVHHINGDINSPIFGIDSNAFTSGDPRFIFTKTYRRMELDMRQSELPDDSPFSNVIIFGCSLSVADYSYYFSLFDKLDISDINSSSKVVFAFAVYDQSNQEEIKANALQSLTALFEEYSKYKGNEKCPNRLLDLLTTQRKVLFYRVW